MSGETNMMDKERVEKAYLENIDEGLDKAHAGSKEQAVDFDLPTARIIIFSDHHKGVRDGADDFLLCEKAYHAALGYYLESGYTLVILGDAEDLWECRPGPVVRAYANTLALEAEFLTGDRYYRIYGNHDDFWRERGTMNRYLVPKGSGKSIPVREAMRIGFLDKRKKVGNMFLVHGHQGTISSDRLGSISRLFVRYVWRNFQRLTKIKSTTPARDARMRDQHTIAMYHWALNKNKNGENVVLVAGHTHLPVFISRDHVGKIKGEFEALQGKLKKAQKKRGNVRAQALAAQVAEKRAELEYLRAKERGMSSEERGISMEMPCYFNTGCCSFSDGDVTGIEISRGEVKLVRWPDDQGNPRAKVLDSADLKKEIFAKLRNLQTHAPVK